MSRHDRLHHGHVAVGDGVDQRRADAGEAEEVLDDDDAAGQPGEVEADHLEGRARCALGSAWRQSTTRSGRPLRRAIITYSLSSTSMVEARRMRVMYGATASVSVSAGRMNMLELLHERHAGVDVRDRRQPVEHLGREQQDQDDADDELGQRRQREVADGDRDVELASLAVTALSEPMSDRERDAEQGRDEHQGGGVDDAPAEAASVTGSPCDERVAEVAA